ncbi:MAG: tetratricopeptide repeat protein [Planctomycetota bacterium]
MILRFGQLLILLLFGAGLLFGQRSHQDYTRATTAFRDGQFFDAELHFARVAKANPQSARGHFGLALCQVRTARLPSALKNFERALKASDVNAQVYLHYGITLEAHSQPEAANLALQRAVELAPNNAEAWLHRGRTRLGLGKTLDARSDFERSLKLSPALTGAREEIAALDSRAGKWPQAEKSLLSILKAEPRRVRSLFLLSRNYARAKNRVQAKACLAKWREAEAAQSARLRAEKRLFSLLALAFKSLRAHRFDEAWAYIEAGLKTAPRHPSARKSVHSILQKLGKDKKHAAMRAKIRRRLAEMKRNSASPRPGLPR